jgi:hypothetical protein
VNTGNLLVSAAFSYSLSSVDCRQLIAGQHHFQRRVNYMKMLRYLFAIALVFGLTSAAKAGPPTSPTGTPGFQMVVVDPTVPIDIIQLVTSDDFALDFPTSGPAAGCSTTDGQLPASDTGYSACFTGINLTGAPLTSLQIELPESVGSINCSDTFADNDFTNITCTPTGGDYLFDFTGGDIPTATLANSSCFFDPFPDVDCNSPAIFTIAIGFSEVNPADPSGPPIVEDLDTPAALAGINGAVADADLPTPEPSSLLLMSTGVLSLGLFGAYRRRQSLTLARPPVSSNLS